MITKRNLKVMVVAIIASYFTLISFNNFTDYATNHWAVQNVLSMENVRANDVKWRAIQSAWIISSAFNLIIIIETVIALLCWLAVISCC